MWYDTWRNSIKFPKKSSLVAFISVDSPNSRRDHTNVVRLPTPIFGASFCRTWHLTKGATPWEHSLPPLSASVTIFIPAC